MLNKLPGITKPKKRLGRGIASGKGSKSGRGMKGQKARAGYTKRAGFEGGQTPLFQRLPKKEGAKSRYLKKSGSNYVAITLNDINKILKDETVGIVGPGFLRQAGLIKNKSDKIKLINSGNLKQPLTVRVHAATKNAIQAVEKTGGKVELIKKTASNQK